MNKTPHPITARKKFIEFEGQISQILPKGKNVRKTEISKKKVRLFFDFLFSKFCFRSQSLKPNPTLHNTLRTYLAFHAAAHVISWRRSSRWACASCAENARQWAAGGAFLWLPELLACFLRALGRIENSTPRRERL